MALALHSHTVPVTTAFLPRGGALGHHLQVREVQAANASTLQWIAGMWYKIPRAGRYFVSGNLGTLCLFILERTIRLWIESMDKPPRNADSISYFSAYFLHVTVQHALHALLVYGLESINTRQKYTVTLWGTYEAYIASAIGSTILNGWLLRIQVDRTVAFFLVMSVFSIFNYVWISRVAIKAKETGRTDAEVHEMISRASRGRISKREQARLASIRGGESAEATVSAMVSGLILFVGDSLLDSRTIPSAATP